MDRSLVTAAVLLDYSQAFQTVNHKLLLAKLEFYGCSGGSIQWFSSYLFNRQQATVILQDSGEKLTSDFACCPLGTAQGSILSPCLFTMYTADFSAQVRYSITHAYADDSQIYLSFSPSDVEQALGDLQTDLNSIGKWAVSNGLLINPKKTQAILFGSEVLSGRAREEAQCLTLHGETVSFSSHVKNLGLTMDSKLRYTEHVSQTIRKAFLRIRGLFKFKRLLSVEVKKQVYDMLVLSLFNYCDSVYGPALLQTDADRIQKVQNTCLRHIYLVKRFEVTNNVPTPIHITPYRLRAGWTTMAERRDHHFVCFVHKVVITKAPPYLYRKLTFRNDVSTVNTRRRYDLQVPRPRTEFFRVSFSYNAPYRYNRVSESKKKLGLAAFKTAMR
jgi:hypothetical protein